jgi:exoribonuclease R
VPRRRFLLTLPAPALEAGLQRLRAELKVPDGFPPEVEEEARTAAAAEPALDGRLDATDVPFVTIDPPGSRDLDQAFHAERRGDGYRVRYAIADVAAFVAPGGALDLEAHRRGQTLYCPDCRTPLYPTVLSEGAASLLAAVERPALLWTIDLDARGVQTNVSIARASVRNRAQLDYAGVQAALDAGEADAITFGRPFLANPDLVERLRRDAPLNPDVMATWYSQGPEGYIDYPALEGAPA